MSPENLYFFLAKTCGTYMLPGDVNVIFNFRQCSNNDLGLHTSPMMNKWVAPWSMYLQALSLHSREEICSPKALLHLIRPSLGILCHSAAVDDVDYDFSRTGSVEVTVVVAFAGNQVYCLETSSLCHVYHVMVLEAHWFKTLFRLLVHHNKNRKPLPNVLYCFVIVYLIFVPIQFKSSRLRSPNQQQSSRINDMYLDGLFIC